MKYIIYSTNGRETEHELVIKIYPDSKQRKIQQSQHAYHGLHVFLICFWSGTKRAVSNVFLITAIELFFFLVSVLSKALLPPDNNTESTLFEDQKPTFSARNHNYTDCCTSRNVSSNCLGFCNIQSILEGIYYIHK